MLAIIIPYYKLTYFKETLDSLESQTDKRFKVYIGDDASPEDPNVILENYKGKFDLEYHRFEYNLGSKSLTKQWERCIALSHDEEWLMILGDDDYLENNVVEEFYNLLDSQKGKRLDLIRFRIQIIDKNGVFQKNEFLYQDYESEQKLLERIFSIKETISASEFVFSRNVYKEYNGFVNFPLAWFSDYATWLLFGKKSGIYNLTVASVYWRLSDINISSKSNDVKTIQLKINSLFLFMSFLQNHFVLDNLKQKKFVFIHLTNLLSNVTILQSCKILSRYLFRRKFVILDKVVLEFILKKVKEKTIRIYGNFCSTRKG
jgi:glycosyltransferase involved in cell wall biosynthesis